MRLGGAKYKSAIDYLETEYMDPEVEEHCKELLSQWKKDECNVNDQLYELGTIIKNVIQRLDDLNLHPQHHTVCYPWLAAYPEISKINTLVYATP